MNYEPLSKIFYKNNDMYDQIYLNRLNDEAAYQYDFMVGGHKAFVLINLEILNLVANILKKDKKLLSIIMGLPSIAIGQFTKTCIIDEIKLTNEIEGVHSTRKEIKDIMDNAAKEKHNRLSGLVKKYLLLLNRQHIALKSCQDIRKLYDEFLFLEIKAADPKNLPDGNIFRKEIVEIVSASQKVMHKGLYPEAKIIEAMTIALNALNDREMNSLVKIAVFHYMFAYIHPFYDGNGRMARFISSYLIEKELEPIVSFGLSYTIREKIKKYYDMFKETNDGKNKGDLTPFVIGFLELINESIASLNDKLAAKSEKLNFYTEKIASYAGNNQQLYHILYILIQNTLFGEEGMGVAEIAQILGISISTVRNQLRDIPTPMMVTSQSGRIKIYDINLDTLAKV